MDVVFEAIYTPTVCMRFLGARARVVSVYQPWTRRSWKFQHVSAKNGVAKQGGTIAGKHQVPHCGPCSRSEARRPSLETESGPGTCHPKQMCLNLLLHEAMEAGIRYDAEVNVSNTE